jgi:hypothetical protein
MPPFITSPYGLRSALFGAAAWASGVGVARFLGFTFSEKGFGGYSRGVSQAILHVGTVGAGIILPKFLAMAGVPEDQLFEGMVVATAVAGCMDGLAISFFRDATYKLKGEEMAHLGAVLLVALNAPLLVMDYFRK